MRWNLRILIISVMAGLVWLPATTASASRPDITRFEIAGGPDTFTDACGPGVHLTGFFQLRGSETVYYDRDGVPIRIVFHTDFRGELTRSDTGQTVRDPGHSTYVIDLVEGTATLTGLVYAITVPGSGIVFHGTGRIIFDSAGDVVFVAGPKDLVDGLDPFEEVCAATA